MRIVAVGDTHGHHDQLDLPDGDVLIHAGDFSITGTPDDVRSFVFWLKEQPFEHRIVIAGNHEACLDPEAELGDHDPEAREEALGTLRESEVTYLENESVTVNGLKIYGSPQTPTFEGWAFEQGKKGLEETYQNIPGDTDVLVTHGPPRGILDAVPITDAVTRHEGHYERTDDGELRLKRDHVGSESLREAVERVRPEYHLFGHIHASYGREKTDDTTFYNVALVDGSLNITNDPVVIDLE